MNRREAFEEKIKRLLSRRSDNSRQGRVAIYEFSRSMLRAALQADPEVIGGASGQSGNQARNQARNQMYLDLEDAIRGVEDGVRNAVADVPPGPVPEWALPADSGQPVVDTAPRTYGGVYRSFAALPAMLIHMFKTAFAKDPLGYILLFVAPVIQIGAHFWAYFFLTHGDVMGMPALPFLITGIGGWHMFRIMTLKIGQQSFRYRNLVDLPPISTLTIMLATGLEIAALYTIIVSVALAVVSWTGGAQPPADLLMVAFYWSLLAASGMGLGLLLNAIREFIPGIITMVTPVFRVGFFFSGVVFVSEQFPKSFRIFIIWDPIVHIMQLLRTGYFKLYRTEDGSALVAIFFPLTVLLLGLTGELIRLRRVSLA